MHFYGAARQIVGIAARDVLGKHAVGLNDAVRSASDFDSRVAAAKRWLSNMLKSSGGPYLEDRTTIAFARLLGREFGGFGLLQAWAVSPKTGTTIDAQACSACDGVDFRFGYQSRAKSTRSPHLLNHT